MLGEAGIELFGTAQGLGPGYKGPGPSSCRYSPECVEGAFYELRAEGVLRNSHAPCNT